MKTANTMTQAELDEVIKLHGMWLDGKAGGKKADLSKQNLDSLDLEGVDLRKAKLDKASLEFTVLTNANLSDASLRGATFKCANMRCSDLTDAVAVGADFDGAYLQRADLAGADLRNAHFSNTYLTGADLRDTNIKGAKFSQVKFLEALLPTGVYQVTGVWANPYNSVAYDAVNDRVIFEGWWDERGRLEKFKEFIESKDLEPENLTEYRAAMKFFETMRELRRQRVKIAKDLESYIKEE